MIIIWVSYTEHGWFTAFEGIREYGNKKVMYFYTSSFGKIAPEICVTDYH